MRIGILDYGVGNLYSLKTALEKLGVQPIITNSLEDGDSYNGIILPGVGNFSMVTRSLGENKKHILRWIGDSNPVLGICLGMQLFFDQSDEGPGDGLALFPGRVRKLPTDMKIPHMRWNILKKRIEMELFEGLGDASWVYFVHSFYPDAIDRDIVAAETDYGIDFASVIASTTKSVYGTQFHPEKSGVTGERILRNFISTCRG